MKILYLAKRNYMRHDLIMDRYARLYELPTQLSNLGHQILAVCLSYKKTEPGKFIHHNRSNQPVFWYSFNIGTFILPGLVNYFKSLSGFIRSFHPDLIFASSDVFHIILASILSQVFRVPFIADLYDNYESFGMAKMPGMRFLYRKALKQARLVSVVSVPLHDYIQSIAPHAHIVVLESTVDPDVFKPVDKIQAKQKFGLDINTPYIGAAGALSRDRGIQVLYDAYMQSIKTSPLLSLVLAGEIDPGCPPPNHPNIIHLGNLSHNDMPAFYCAADVAVICMIGTEFGRYAFPQKAYEIMSCKTPIIAADVGPLKHTLANYPQCLYQEGNANDLSQKLLLQITDPVIPDIHIPSWEDQAIQLHRAILSQSVANDP